MFSLLSPSTIFIITVCSLIIQINGQVQKENESNSTSGNENKGLSNIETPSIPPHNDTSRDNEGADHDSEPMRNNGRGTHEANSQNNAAETNGIHGMPITDFQQIILDQHNLYRRQMCANNLETDEDLHRIAEQRAHSEANGRKLPLPADYNENIFELDTGDPSKVTGDMIVKSWYDQRQQYDLNNESSATDFTQLVWKKTNKIGVGHAYNGQKLYVSVVYKPSGNIRGQFAANVGCDANGQGNQAHR